jgi:hypothetical protein
LKKAWAFLRIAELVWMKIIDAFGLRMAGSLWLKLGRRFIDLKIINIRAILYRTTT